MALEGKARTMRHNQMALNFCFCLKNCNEMCASVTNVRLNGGCCCWCLVVLVYVLSFHGLDLTLVKSEDDMMVEGQEHTLEKYLKDVGMPWPVCLSG